MLFYSSTVRIPAQYSGIMQHGKAKSTSPCTFPTNIIDRLKFADSTAPADAYSDAPGGVFYYSPA